MERLGSAPLGLARKGVSDFARLATTAPDVEFGYPDGGQAVEETVALLRLNPGVVVP